MGSRLLLTRIRENSACILLSPVLQTETSTLPQGIVQTLQNLCISRNNGLIGRGAVRIAITLQRDSFFTDCQRDMFC